MVDSVRYAIHIDYNENLVSVHSTVCPEYQRSRNEYNKGLWLGPFDKFEDACMVSEMYTVNLGCCKKCISLVVQDILSFEKPKLKNN